MKNKWWYGNIVIELHMNGGYIVTVKIVKQTKDGENTKNVEIKKMNLSQTTKVAKGVGGLLKFANNNERVKNIFKVFNEVREEEKQKAVAYYKEQKQSKKKESEIEEYNIGEEAFVRTGTLVWNDLVAVLSDLLTEIPDTIVQIVSDASGIEKEDLDEQSLETFLDVIDQVVENNDLPALIERVKKSKGTFSKITTMFKTPEKA